LPVYTFKTICSEDNRIELYDGVTKIIINSKAAEQEKNEKLKVFLEYMNGKVSDDEFIQRLERRIKEVSSTAVPPCTAVDGQFYQIKLAAA